MNLTEAANLLDLPLDASPEQLNARLSQLRSRLQEKIASAPGAILKEKHLVTLAKINAAGELLKLSAEIYQPGSHSASTVTAAPFPTISSPPLPRPAPQPIPSASTPPAAPTPAAAAVAPTDRRPEGPATGSRRNLVIVTLLVLIGGGAVTFLATRSSDAAPSAAADALPERLRAAQGRWAALEAELAAAERDRANLESQSPLTTPERPAPVVAENQARLQAQNDFIAWSRPYLAKSPAKPQLDRLAVLVAARTFPEATEAEAGLRKLLEQAETELAGQKTRLLALALTMEIVSEPAGLRYTLKDAYGWVTEGLTPAKIDAPWGPMRLAIVAPGADWEDWQRELTVNRDTVAEVKAVFGRAPVRLASVPDGLAYELSRPTGKGPLLRGVTPAQLTDVPTGPALLRVVRPGWPDREQTVEIAAGSNIFTTEFVSGSLIIESEPAGATVSADGKTLGVTPLNLSDLPPGERTYAVTLSGHEAGTARAQVTAGGRVRTQVALKRVTALEPGKPYVVPELALTLMPIPAGTFVMGSSSLDPTHNSDESSHEVVISQEFWLGRHEVTRAQWRVIMETALLDPKDDLLPVTRVSWEDAMEFGRKLTARERAAGRLPVGFAYTLPTEAQWEYACRAGNPGLYGGAGALDVQAWYQLNSEGRAHPVGQKQANAWGLYDMHGNVWEWCADWFAFYPSGKVIDPIGPSEGAGKINRGGGWGSSASTCRSASRLNLTPTDRSSNLGFRLALTREGEPGRAADKASPNR